MRANLYLLGHRRSSLLLSLAQRTPRPGRVSTAALAGATWNRQRRRSTRLSTKHIAPRRTLPIIVKEPRRKKRQLRQQQLRPHLHHLRRGRRPWGWPQLHKQHNNQSPHKRREPHYLWYDVSCIEPDGLPRERCLSIPISTLRCQMGMTRDIIGYLPFL